MTTAKIKTIRFACEPISLRCEWEDCAVIEKDIEIFISHLIQQHMGNINEGDLHCHWKDCEGFTESLPELRRHILLHAFHTKLKCYGSILQLHKKMPDCSSGLQSRNLIPELPDPLICCWNECLDEYDCPEYYYRHADYHAECESKREDKAIVCLWQGCNRTFNDISKVKEHLRSHTQEKLIACPICGAMFASRTKFFDHIQRQLPVVDDSEEGAYVCEYCCRKMNSERLLRDHMRHHVNHYKCPYCDMTCPTPSGLQIHVTYRHSQNKPHACQYCDYRCKTEHDLRKHLESHSDMPTYKCQIENCKYASRSPTCYAAHYRKAHEEKQAAKYCCHLCLKAFSRGNYLTKHLLNHHKFRWPSGHCRFRYCLNEDGTYRLQTVRYESMELSETMMGNSMEDVDDPDSMNEPLNEENRHSNIPIESTSLLHTSESSMLHSSNGNIYHHIASSTINSSIEFCVEEKRGNAYSDDSTVANEFNSGHCEQEPVLIQILDVTDSSGYVYDESGLFVLSPEHTSVGDSSRMQTIAKDSNGTIVYETVEIIPQYEDSIHQS